MAKAPAPKPRSMNGRNGRPGSIAIPIATAEVRKSGRAFCPNCESTSLPRSLPDAARATIKPDAAEIMIDGNCATSPSPIVRIV